MTIIDAAPLAFRPAPAEPTARRHALWPARVAAVVVDHALLAAATFLLVPVQPVTPLTLPGLPPTASWTVLGFPEGTLSGTHLAWMAGLVATMMLLQAYTGATPGKLALGIKVVRADDGRPAGFWRTAVRAAAHLLDWILLLGFLRPLWHRERRTFADSIAGTVVVVNRPPTRLRAAVVALAVPALALTYAPQSGTLDGPGWWGECTRQDWVDADGTRLVGGWVDASPGSTGTVQRLGIRRADRDVRDPGVRVVWNLPGVWERGDATELTVTFTSADGTDSRTTPARMTVDGLTATGGGRPDGDALMLPWSAVDGLGDDWTFTLAATTPSGADLGTCTGQAVAWHS